MFLFSIFIAPQERFCIVFLSSIKYQNISIRFVYILPGIFLLSCTQLLKSNKVQIFLNIIERKNKSSLDFFKVNKVCKWLLFSIVFCLNQSCPLGGSFYTFFFFLFRSSQINTNEKNRYYSKYFAIRLTIFVSQNKKRKINVLLSCDEF